MNSIEKYVDSHAHYTSFKFDGDRDVVLNLLFETFTDKIIECGTNSSTNKAVLALCGRYKNMYATIGYFPLSVGALEDSRAWEDFLKLLEHPKVVGIGEIGLDRYHPGNMNLQKKWFVKQLELAREMNLPVCIHSRDAEEETLQILLDHGKTTGVIHCYSYGTKTMEKLVELGYYFGVGGTSTYRKNVELREAIKQMPLERIVLETDAPYLSPEGIRKQRNDSSNIGIVIDEIAQLKNLSFERIIAQTNKNVRALYPRL